MALKDFPLWKTLHIGGVPREEVLSWIPDSYVHRHGGEVRNKLQKRLRDCKGFRTEREPRELRLGRANLAGLEFKEGKNPTITEILARICFLGHQPCPPEVGPWLQKAYRNQPEDEDLDIAMDPLVSISEITGTMECHIFYLDKFDGQPRLELSSVGRVESVGPMYVLSHGYHYYPYGQQMVYGTRFEWDLVFVLGGRY